MSAKYYVKCDVCEILPAVDVSLRCALSLAKIHRLAAGHDAEITPVLWAEESREEAAQ